MLLNFFMCCSIGLNVLAGALSFYVTIKTGSTFYISMGAVNLGLAFMLYQIIRKDF